MGKLFGALHNSAPELLPSSVPVPVPVSSLIELSVSLISASYPPPRVVVLWVEIDHIRLVVARR